MEGRGKLAVAGMSPRRARRLLERGDIKYVILDLLSERARHGYEIIRVLEDWSGGLYAPSPGTVYPTLEMLADLGYVAAQEQEGKKTFGITEAGRRFLEDQRGVVEEARARMSSWAAPAAREELRAVWKELRTLGQMLRKRRAQMDAGRLRHVREALVRASGEIETVLEAEEAGS